MSLSVSPDSHDARDGQLGRQRPAVRSVERASPSAHRFRPSEHAHGPALHPGRRVPLRGLREAERGSAGTSAHAAWARHACMVAGRRLTRAEWADALPAARTPRPARGSGRCVERCKSGMISSSAGGTNAELSRRTSGRMAEITFQNVWKRYPDGFEAVKDMSLEISDGEFMILVGPSGCGKSTALRMVAGLEDITDGELIIGGERVNELAPRDRDIAIVFQNYALYPHMTVRENMGFALQAREGQQERDRQEGRRGGGDPRARPAPRSQAREPLRRPAPARGDGARDRARPQGLPDGRAAVEPRRQAARARCARRWRGSRTSSARRCSTSPTTRPRR